MANYLDNQRDSLDTQKENIGNQSVNTIRQTVWKVGQSKQPRFLSTRTRHNVRTLGLSIQALRQTLHYQDIQCRRPDSLYDQAHSVDTQINYLDSGKIIFGLFMKPIYIQLKNTECQAACLGNPDNQTYFLHTETKYLDTRADNLHSQINGIDCQTDNVDRKSRLSYNLILKPF